MLGIDNEQPRREQQFVGQRPQPPPLVLQLAVEPVGDRSAPDVRSGQAGQRIERAGQSGRAAFELVGRHAEIGGGGHDAAPNYDVAAAMA